MKLDGKGNRSVSLLNRMGEGMAKVVGGESRTQGEKRADGGNGAKEADRLFFMGRWRPGGQGGEGGGPQSTAGQGQKQLVASQRAAGSNAAKQPGSTSSGPPQVGVDTDVYQVYTECMPNCLTSRRSLDRPLLTSSQ